MQADTDKHSTQANAVEKISRIGKYDIIREIGHGGMGTVYQAYDPFRDRFVALKIPKEPKSAPEQQSTDYERLFYNEINAASSLNHPNIIEINDAGMDEGVHYIAMEYIAGGGTLKKYCKPDNLLPLEISGQIFLKCAEAMDYAHRKGIIHRDIKPGNIMLKDERDVKISDFGLAMLIHPDLADTQTVTTMGSPLYMAPEILSDEGITHHVDIYSMGVVIYEALTGRTPFNADNMAALTQQVLTETPSAPSSLRPNLPKMADEIVARAMARQPQDRYQSMMALAIDLSLCFQDVDSPLDHGVAELRTEKLRQLPFFHEFGEAEIWELLRWSEWRDTRDDEIVISEGEIGDTMYILVHGEMEVIKQERVVTILPEGEIFGEMAFLSMRRRSATVRAKGICTILALSIHQIDRASERCQIQFQRLLINTLAERLIRTTEQMISKT